MLSDIGPEDLDNLWLQLSTCIVLNDEFKFANKVKKYKNKQNKKQQLGHIH